jgi:hypothetical protein
MKQRFQRFLDETRIAPDKGWKQRLLGYKSSTRLGFDLAYLGGQSLADILAGRVTDNDLDPRILDAYRLQYPDLSNNKPLVDEIRSLAHDPDRLHGLVSGLKGKVFEVDYHNYLNNSHLPSGFHAELSAKPNEPGVDILIRDNHDNVIVAEQLKTSETPSGMLKEVHEHLQRYPQFDVVVIPKDQMHDALAAGLGRHVVAGNDTQAHLDHLTQSTIDLAESSGHLHLPEIGLCLLVGEAAILFYRGENFQAQHFIKRGAKITAASLVAQICVLITSMSWLVMPVALGVRAGFDKYDVFKNLEEYLIKRKTWVETHLRKYPRSQLLLTHSALEIKQASLPLPEN